MIGVFFLGIAAGIVSGMGIGGGTLLIPGLVFFAHVTQHQAQGINLLYFIPTGAMALFTHFKNGTVEKKVVKPLVLYGLLGALVGSFCAVSLDGILLRKIFGGFLCFMGILEMYKGKKVWQQRKKKGCDFLDPARFNVLKANFAAADLDGKIRLYTTTEGLTTEQYKDLLRLYPVDSLQKLEDALVG